jgi:hypothetical protein
MSPLQLGMLRSSNTPDSARLVAIKKETLFQFPSPSASELGAMLDISDADMLVPTFGHCHPMRNLTPSLEATMPCTSIHGGRSMLSASQSFAEDINDLARLGGVRASPLRSIKREGPHHRVEDGLAGLAADVDDVFLGITGADQSPASALSAPMSARSDQTPPAVAATSTSQLSCRYCGKVFKKAGRLLTHERKHTGERPFSCTECTKSFRDGAALEGHIARQHREQPFSCHTCNKGFSSKRQLMIHGRVHSGEKPYKCVVCDRKFSQEGNLHTHIRRHMVNFGLDPVTDAAGAEVAGQKSCRLCTVKIVNENELKDHVKYHIKAGDLTKLQDHMVGTPWTYELDYDGRHDSMASFGEETDRNDSMDSFASGTPPGSL